MEIDLMPLLGPLGEYLIMALGAVLTALLGWTAKKVADKAGVEEDSAMMAAVDDLIAKGIASARKRATQELRDANISVEVKDPRIAYVVEFVVEQAPTYVKKLKLDEQKLVKLIESKL